MIRKAAPSPAGVRPVPATTHPEPEFLARSRPDPQPARNTQIAATLRRAGLARYWMERIALPLRPGPAPGVSAVDFYSPRERTFLPFSTIATGSRANIRHGRFHVEEVQLFRPGKASMLTNPQLGDLRPVRRGGGPPDGHQSRGRFGATSGDQPHLTLKDTEHLLTRWRIIGCPHDLTLSELFTTSRYVSGALAL
jgi:hypothetical protein